MKHGWSKGSVEATSSIDRIESAVRQSLSFSLEADLIDPIIREAENDNPAAEFIVAGALEAACMFEEAIAWYGRAADQEYHPAIERLRQLGGGRSLAEPASTEFGNTVS